MRLGSTFATLSGVPEVRFAKCVYLTVAKLDELMIQDPSPVKILSRDSLPGSSGGRGVRGEEVALVDALRVAVARVEEKRLRRREGQLAEALVPRALVVGQLPIEVGPVGPVLGRAVVGAVEVQVVLDDGAAEVGGQPAEVPLVPREAAAVEVRRHGVALELVADLAVEVAGARAADRVDREATGALEVDGAGAALHDRDLGDVVGGGLGGERAEERQVHVDAVELVDVVLSAAPGARPADGVLAVLDARDQLLQVAVLLADRQPHDLLAGEAALDGRRVLVDQGDLGGHRHRLGDSRDTQRRVGSRLLGEQDLGRAGHRLHAGEAEGEGVRPRRQRREAGTRRSRWRPSRGPSGARWTWPGRSRPGARRPPSR